jgi:hypothetical protein
MVWIRVDDRYSEHPKIADVGPLGVSLWLAGLAYCNRNLTDGKIPWAAARALVCWEYLEPPDAEGKRRIVTVSVTSGFAGDEVDSDYVIKLLVNAGLWEEHPGYYYVHDYPDFQPLKSKVLLERGKTLERVRKYREEHSSNVGGNAVTNGDVTPHPEPVPVPKKKEHSAMSLRSLPAGFADLWACYPGPKGPKGEAVKAYATMHPPENVVELLRKQVEYKTRCDKAGVFCAQLPHLFRWLKKERWTDEIPSNGHTPGQDVSKYPLL